MAYDRNVSDIYHDIMHQTATIASFLQDKDYKGVKKRLDDLCKYCSKEFMKELERTRQNDSQDN